MPSRTESGTDRVIGLRWKSFNRAFLLLVAVLVALRFGADEVLAPDWRAMLPDIVALAPAAPAERARDAVARRGASFDARSAAEMIRARRAAGERAFPTLSPAYFLDPGGSKIAVDGRPVLPLGIVPSAATYYCNESGSFAAFRTDRYGFRNADEIWRAGSIDALLIGDSFAMGACLDAEKTIAAGLARGFPRLATLGMGANGPLMVLAGLREYGPSLRPLSVIWLVSSNSIESLARDAANPILARYRDEPDFRQDLMRLSGPLGRETERLSEDYLSLIEAADAQGARSNAPGWYSFPRTRARLQRSMQRKTASPNGDDLQGFEQVLRHVRSEADALGARLGVAFIPDCTEVDGTSGLGAKVAALATGLGIAAVDVTPALRQDDRDGRSAYFFCPGSHFSPEGAHRVATAILSGLPLLRR